MNYLEIVLQGYFNENNREFLDKYFYREYKKAEKEHFEADEFFNGCLKVIEVWERHLQEKVNKRYYDLRIMLANAKDGTLEYEKLEGKSYEQKIQETIQYCEQEISDQRPDGIGSISFTVHLLSLTKGQLAYNMPYSEVLQIKRSILEASKVVLKEKITNLSKYSETQLLIEQPSPATPLTKSNISAPEKKVINKVVKNPTSDQKKFLKAFVKNLTDGHKITYAIETACESSQYSKRQGQNLYREVREGSLKYEPLSEVLSERKQSNNNDIIV